MKPCPHCGNEHPTVTQSSYAVTIRCPQCQTAFSLDGTCGRDYDKQKTIEAWDRRTAVWLDASIEVPVNTECVLALRQGYNTGSGFEIAYHEADRWHIADDGWQLDDVTHWMPLPEIPDEILIQQDAP